MKGHPNNFLIKSNKTGKQGDATTFHRLTYRFKMAVHVVSKHVDQRLKVSNVSDKKRTTKSLQDTPQNLFRIQKCSQQFIPLKGDLTTTNTYMKKESWICMKGHKTIF